MQEYSIKRNLLITFCEYVLYVHVSWLKWDYDIRGLYNSKVITWIVHDVVSLCKMSGDHDLNIFQSKIR